MVPSPRPSRSAARLVCSRRSRRQCRVNLDERHSNLGDPLGQQITYRSTDDHRAGRLHSLSRPRLIRGNPSFFFISSLGTSRARRRLEISGPWKRLLLYRARYIHMRFWADCRLTQIVNSRCGAAPRKKRRDIGASLLLQCRRF